MRFALVPSPPKKNLILSAVRLRRASFLRGFRAAGGGGGASGSSYFKYSAHIRERERDVVVLHKATNILHSLVDKEHAAIQQI